MKTCKCPRDCPEHGPVVTVVPEAGVGFDRDGAFKRWKKAVDAGVRQMSGLSADDLPDCPYRDWYDAGKRPLMAARKAIKLAAE